MEKYKSNKRIVVENVSKTFQIGFKKHQSALERFISLFSGKDPKKTIQALKEVSFEAGKGEISFKARKGEIFKNSFFLFSIR